LGHPKNKVNTYSRKREKKGRGKHIDRKGPVLAIQEGADRPHWKKSVNQRNIKPGAFIERGRQEEKNLERKGLAGRRILDPSRVRWSVLEKQIQGRVARAQLVAGFGDARGKRPSVFQKTRRMEGRFRNGDAIKATVPGTQKSRGKSWRIQGEEVWKAGGGMNVHSSVGQEYRLLKITQVGGFRTKEEVGNGRTPKITVW